jgi:hypothetical protein
MMCFKFLLLDMQRNCFAWFPSSFLHLQRCLLLPISRFSRRGNPERVLIDREAKRDPEHFYDARGRIFTSWCIDLECLLAVIPFDLRCTTVIAQTVQRIELLEGCSFSDHFSHLSSCLHGE